MKTGRPKLDSHEKKASIAGVRLNPRERALLEQAAAKRESKLSEWMRGVLIKNAQKELAA